MIRNFKKRSKIAWALLANIFQVICGYRSFFKGLLLVAPPLYRNNLYKHNLSDCFVGFRRSLYWQTKYKDFGSLSRCIDSIVPLRHYYIYSYFPLVDQSTIPDWWMINHAFPNLLSIKAIEKWQSRINLKSYMSIVRLTWYAAPQTPAYTIKLSA